MKKFQKILTAECIGNLMASAVCWLLSAGFIWWGWSVLAPHLNAPQFSYLEIFAMRMALTHLLKIFWQK